MNLLARTLIIAASMFLVNCATSVSHGPLPEVACAPFPPRVPVGGDNDSLEGFADYHAHMLSHLAFGGYAFSGAPYSLDHELAKDQMAEALAPCQHTRINHLLTAIAVQYVEENWHDRDGYPRFATWPTYKTMYHQQMYIDWIYRSYRHGLRLMVLVLTHSEAMCELLHSKASCNDMEVVESQLEHFAAALPKLESEGWIKLVKTPEEARQAIESNRLAIVLGVEIDTPFDCRTEQDEGCDFETLKPVLDDLYAKGVRQFNPVHLIDNGFGHAAIYDERLALNQHILRPSDLEVDLSGECAGQVDYELQGKKGAGFLGIMSGLKAGRSYDPAYPESSLGNEGHCNRYGLTDPGRRLIRGLMRRGMLIDIDHMSTRAIADTAKISAEVEVSAGKPYPLMAAHSWFRDLKLRLPEGTEIYHSEVVDLHEALDLTAEMHKSNKQIVLVRQSGGVLGVLTNQGIVRDYGGAVANDCDTSSKSLAQALQFAVKQMGQSGGVGLGTDFQGFNGQPGPRFGSDACGNKDHKASFPIQARQVKRLPYPFEAYPFKGKGRVRACMHRAGEKAFDFNVTGLAHYGLLPDLIADLELVGVPDSALRRLFRSANAYIEMWEQAEQVKKFVPPETSD